MWSAQVDVTFEEGDLAGILDREAFARVVVPAALEEVRNVWIEAVTGTQLPGMDRTIDDDVYADALRDPAAVMYPDGEVTSGAVSPVQGDGYERAVRLERGRKPRDMKPALLNGPKARQNKRGGRYNIIPLRPKGTEDVLFRTVSDRSPANSWIYPGVPSAQIVDAVATASEARIEAVVQRALDEWLR